ncbi:MAG: DNA polymerase III subunit chi [Gammaproteobacteria bacterium]|nr:DNA polymerase III subunit chi [Gammaproteobacteria bacterium]
MTRIDFYVLPDASPKGRDLFACRLAEKAYRLGHSVYIQTADAAHAKALDELLWTYAQNSFVPHGIDGESPDPEAPVLIGSTPALRNPEEAHKREVLINLAPEVPLFFSTFARVAEVVNQEEQCKLAGREHYRFYRDRGYSLENHTINPGMT